MMQGWRTATVRAESARPWEQTHAWINPPDPEWGAPWWSATIEKTDRIKNVWGTLHEVVEHCAEAQVANYWISHQGLDRDRLLALFAPGSNVVIESEDDLAHLLTGETP